MKRASFSDWLRQALLFVGRGPLIWAGYCLFIEVILSVGRISLALGIFLSVTCLFVGVGIAKYIDLKYSGDYSIGFYEAINKSLPLAVIAATCIVISWFVFMALANIFSGEFYKIGRFFFYWELTPENLDNKSMREVAGWLYAYANVTLIFVLLMVTTFASWFSYPLMLFRNYSWSEAREQGGKAVAKNQKALYMLLGFVIIEALICTGITPLLTPVLYMLVSTLMYISYKNVFVVIQR
ncbi:MAG: hypothetical protein PHY16_06390 [Methylobacter sp.]|nr:hypothetical protein [Methylobacter sp.]